MPYKVKPEHLGKGSVAHYVKPGDTLMLPCNLDTATQAELKILFEYEHPFVIEDKKSKPD
jgi:hypothetical protein